MRVHEDITELPDGSPGCTAGSRSRRRRSSSPLDDDGVWLVEQFRHPVGERFWEFPQGSWEDVGAIRRGAGAAELAEETGLRAGRLEHLGRLYFAYGISNQSVDVWRATDLAQGERAPEPTEQGLIARRFPRGRGRADGPRERDQGRGVRGGVAPGGAPAALSRAIVCSGWSIACAHVTRSTRQPAASRRRLARDVVLARELVVVPRLAVGLEDQPLFGPAEVRHGRCPSRRLICGLAIPAALDQVEHGVLEL